MNYYSVFYWLTVADGVKRIFNALSNISTFFTIVFLFAYIVIVVVYADTKDEEKPSVLIWKKMIAKSFWAFSIICMTTWICWVAVPTKKDCLLIVAGGAVGNFISNDTSAKAIPSDITKFLHLSLNKEIDDLNKSVKGDIKKELGIQTPKDKFIDKVEKLSKEQLIEYIKNDTTVSVTK